MNIRTRVNKNLKILSSLSVLSESMRELIAEYIESYNTMNLLANSDYRTPRMMDVTPAAQEGVTISTNKGGMAFRILTNYKKKGDKINSYIAINFVNWRNWEKILPLDSNNHFYVGGKSFQKETGKIHGYYHSFYFKTEEEFVNFFKTYVMLTFIE